MALGVPAVATDIRGVRELLEHGSGSLVPLGDHRSLARAMDQLADQPDLVREMAENARRRISIYDTRHLLELHEQLYAEALNLTSLRSRDDG